MTAPTPTARQAPTGTKLDDPFPTTYAFSLAPSVGLWEKSVKPPGLDGREPINTATMFNQRWVGKAPRVLVDMTALTAKVQYDPAVLPTLVNTLLNKKGTITVWFASGASWCFYGYLQKFTPTENSDSAEPPMADVEIMPTNTDPATNAEAGPIYTASSGTGSIT